MTLYFIASSFVLSKLTCSQHIKLNKALKISLAFGIFQGIMPLIGWFCGLGFRELLIRVNHWIAFILLVVIGIKMIYETCQTETETKFNPLDNYTLLGLAICEA